jgi:hypothetical protein
VAVLFLSFQPAMASKMKKNGYISQPLLSPVFKLQAAKPCEKNRRKIIRTLL